MSQNVTYSLFLGLHSEDNPKYPLSFSDTEAVVVSCILAQRAERELRWHLRGSLRSGMSPNEVEALQTAVELVGEELGFDVKTNMPRVRDVTEEDDLSEL